MAAAVTGAVQLQSHMFRNPSDVRDEEATPFARRSTHRIEHKDDCEYSKWYDATARWQPWHPLSEVVREIVVDEFCTCIDPGPEPEERFIIRDSIDPYFQRGL